MEIGALIILALAVFIIAALYATVGHGGASGYLAALALAGVVPGIMKPTALALNIIVASIGTYKYYRAGCFSWPVFLPFAALSVPAAFIGGAIVLPPVVYRPVVGVILLYAAYRMFRKARKSSEQTLKAAPIWLALFIGAALGLLSGLTGVGGGIFLSPLLLLTGWADTKTTLGVSAMFILVNSIAGLFGHFTVVSTLPSFLPYLAVAALAGGWIGAEIGSRHLRPRSIQYVLSVVLVIAAFKMIAT